MTLPKKLNVFISYAHEDASLARFIASLVERTGIEIWHDEKVLPGVDLSEQLAEHLKKANLYVLLVTPNYLQSSWGNFELGVALARASRSDDVTVLPVTVGVSAGELPLELRSFKAVSLDRNPGELQQALESALHEVS